MMGQAFEVHSALGRCRFTPTKSPTPVALPARHLPTAGDSDSLAPQDLVRRQNEQLSQLKEQYLRLHEQFKEEQKDSSAKLLDLQRELRSEQKRVEEFEDEIGALARAGQSSSGSRSIEAVEQIWRLMQEYRDAVHPGGARGRKEEEPQFQRAITPRLETESPRSAGGRTEGQSRRFKF
jgi:hypothetical protein